MTQQEIIDKVFKVAKSKGIRDNQLAKMAGYCPNTVCNIRKNGRPTLETIISMAGAVGLELTLK